DQQDRLVELGQQCLQLLLDTPERGRDALALVRLPFPRCLSDEREELAFGHVAGSLHTRGTVEWAETDDVLVARAEDVSRGRDVRKLDLERRQGPAYGEQRKARQDARGVPV